MAYVAKTFPMNAKEYKLSTLFGDKQKTYNDYEIQ